MGDPSKCPPGKICDESPSDEPDAMKEGVGTSPHHHHHHKFDPNSVFDPSKCPPGKVCDESPSDEQDAMNEVSGTEKGLASNIKKGGKAVAKAVKKMVKSGAWRTFLPGNNPWYDENPSDEQDAMKEEVSGTSPHHHHHKFDPNSV